MAPTSTKRKHDDLGDEIVSFKLSSQPASQLGPVLVSFPGVQPPKSTSFHCYRLNKEQTEEDKAEFASQPTIVAGETSAVEYFSAAESSAIGCRYLVAIHDKRTNTTTFRPAPVHLLTRQVKKLKNIDPIPVTVAQRIEARNKLGVTFGTKKAKAAIKAHERNRVNADAMQSVVSHLQSTIEESTVNLPSQEQAIAVADEHRLIPPFDPNAGRPEDIYAVQGIIPDAEWNAVSISAMTSAESHRERRALLPYTRSTWLDQHLHQAFSTNIPDKATIRLLFCISAMFAFYNARRMVDEKEKLRERLTRIPPALLDGLLSRFTETVRGSTKARSTPQTETMLLTYMFALCLRVDGFATDTTLIASDLAMNVTRVNGYFRALGCTIAYLRSTDLQLLRLPESAGLTKRAILKAPVTFPKLRRKRTN